jgi:hypothetical protein
MTFEITEPMVRKLLDTVDAGLVNGLGKPIPGQMCVEAAISFALGEPHSDGPSCVEPVVRQSKIALNDKRWSSDVARAKGLRRVAIAQLGSKGVVNGKRYLALVAEGTIREIVPIALRAAAKVNPKYAVALEVAAVRCEQEGSHEAALAARPATSTYNAAYNAAYAVVYDTAYAVVYDTAYTYASAYDTAYAAAASAASAAYASASVRDSILTRLAEIMVRALKECGSPGCDWLWLVDGEERP